MAAPLLRQPPLLAVSRQSNLGDLFSRLFDIETIKIVEHAHKPRHSRLTRPITLELAVHLHTADELDTSLLKTALINASVIGG